MKKFLAPAAMALLALIACDRSDKSSPTDPGSGSAKRVTGILRYSDGRPAAGASVKIYAIDYLPGGGAAKVSAAALFSTRTDTAGRYTVDSLPAGEYNILGQKDELQSYQDSVYLSATPKDLDPDTLLTAGMLSGRVALQPNHNFETVTIQALGTNAYANADAEGRFVLGPLAEGRYRLRIVTTETQYTPLFAPVQVRAGRADSLAATLTPVYTGIPVVTGMAASYDTLHGVVGLSWNGVKYPQFQEYEVLRSRAAEVGSSFMSVGRTSDTVFRDSLYTPSPSLPSGSEGGFNDYPGATDHRLYYRVRVIDKSERPGLTFGRILVDAVPPSMVQAQIAIAVSNYPSGKSLQGPGLLASPGDSLRINATFSDAGRRITRVRWYRNGESRPMRVDTITPPAFTGTVSLVHLTGSPGREGYRVEAEDDGGLKWSESLLWQVVDDVPSLAVGKDTLVSRGGRVHLHAKGSDGFGSIVKWEWDIGATGTYRQTSGPETSFVAPTAIGTISCLVRVTDDDGFTNEGKTTVTVGITWSNVPASFDGGFNGRVESPSVESFQGKLWALGGLIESDPRLPDASAHIAVSEDGVSWRAVPTPISVFNSRFGQRSLVYHDRLWVFGGMSAQWDPNLQDVWSSADGAEWRQETENNLPCHLGFDAVVFQDKMWCLGGGIRNNHPTSAWYTEDGAHWTEATSDSPFPQLEGHTAVVHDGKIFIFGGDDPATGKLSTTVWSSANGLHWTKVAENPAFGFGTSIHALDYAVIMWVFGGDHARYHNPEFYSSSPVQGIWFTDDGMQWERNPDPVLPPPLVWEQHQEYWPYAPYAFASTVFQGKVWTLFGRKVDTYWPSIWTAQ